MSKVSVTVAVPEDIKGHELEFCDRVCRAICTTLVNEEREEDALLFVDDLAETMDMNTLDNLDKIVEAASKYLTVTLVRMPEIELIRTALLKSIDSMESLGIPNTDENIKGMREIAQNAQSANLLKALLKHTTDMLKITQVMLQLRVLEQVHEKMGGRYDESLH